MFGMTNTGNTGTNLINQSVSFSLQSTPDYADYPYRATYSNSTVTDATYAEVTYSEVQALSGHFAPFCRSFNGGVYLYANANVGSQTIPTLTIGIPTASPTFNLLSVYPVGSIYMSVASTNPSSLFGGTWSQLAPGRVLMGAGDSSYPAGSTGGEATHTLTTNEMPSHGHGVYLDGAGVYTGRRGFNTGGGAKAFTRDGADSGDYNQWVGDHNHTVHQSNAGGGQAHNNLQPYLVVYMWQRTA